MKETFNLHDFVMKTLKGMSEKYSEFQVREFALNWYTAKVLVDSDLIEIESWYNVPTVIPEVDTPTVIPEVSSDI